MGGDIMGSGTMGKVFVAAKIENMEDLFAVRKGELAPDAVRTVEVTDALVDTGATMLSLPGKLIRQLGLQKFRKRRAQTTAGVKDFDVYGTVQLTVQDRDCHVDVAELPDDCPALIGQVPLELLDFVVDPVGQRLIGNPAHGGEQMIELF
jgi:predicted aspartyl protease